MNTMIENLRLFEKGLAHFDEDKDKLENYLLKSLEPSFSAIGHYFHISWHPSVRGAGAPCMDPGGL